MKISVLHPSRGRPQQAFETAKKYIQSADMPFEYILSLDISDETKPEYYALFENNVGNGICLTYDNNSAIEAINRAAQICTGDLFVVISDDFDCPDHWDTLLLSELSGKSDFLLKTQDGIQPTLVTLPILDRKYYERFGYIYNAEYLHMAADVELTAVGMMLGRLIKSTLLFEHRHYSTGKTQKDIINEKNDRTYQHGDEVLARHLVNNFGISNPLIQYDQIQWH